MEGAIKRAKDYTFRISAKMNLEANLYREHGTSSN